MIQLNSSGNLKSAYFVSQGLDEDINTLASTSHWSDMADPQLFSSVVYRLLVQEYDEVVAVLSDVLKEQIHIRVEEFNHLKAQPRTDKQVTLLKDLKREIKCLEDILKNVVQWDKLAKRDITKFRQDLTAVLNTPGY